MRLGLRYGGRVSSGGITTSTILPNILYVLPSSSHNSQAESVASKAVPVVLQLDRMVFLIVNVFMPLRFFLCHLFWLEVDIFLALVEMD